MYSNFKALSPVSMVFLIESIIFGVTNMASWIGKSEIGFAFDHNINSLKWITHVSPMFFVMQTKCSVRFSVMYFTSRTTYYFHEIVFFSFHSTFVHMPKLGISFRSLSTHWRSHLALLLIRFCAILAITNLIRIIMNGTRKLTTTTTATKMLTKK